MGVSKTPIQLAQKLRKLEVELPKNISAGEIKAAEVVRAAVSVASGPYANSPLVKTRATLLPDQTVLVRMTHRKAHLLDHHTKGGMTILPGAVTGRRGQKQALLTPQGPRASAVKGPTRGKFMWELGVAAARPNIVKAIGSTVSDTLGKVFSR